MSDLNKLTEEYQLVSNKTNALHNMSEQLLADQNKLSSIGKFILFCVVFKEDHRDEYHISSIYSTYLTIM